MHERRDARLCNGGIQVRLRHVYIALQLSVQIRGQLSRYAGQMSFGSSKVRHLGLHPLSSASFQYILLIHVILPCASNRDSPVRGPRH